MAKFNILFDGSWDYSGNTWINDNVTFYNAADEVVTDTAEATQWEINEGVTKLGDGVFGSCSVLNSIVIPNTIMIIGDSTFYGCRSMTSIVIPSSVTTLEVSAFGGCATLATITISDSVTTIGGYVFEGCPELATIYVDPASSLESMKTVMGVNNPDQVALMVGAPAVSDKTSVNFLVDESGVNFVPVAHADTTFLNELNVDGKSKSVAEKFTEKQDNLVSGTSIKTINGESVLGSGDIEIVGPTIVQTTGTSTSELMSQNAVTTSLNTLFKGVEYASATGILTFTKFDNSTVEIDLPLEFIVESGSYDPIEEEIVLVLANGDEIRIPVSALIDNYTGVNGTTVNVTVSGREIAAEVKDGSISMAKIDTAFQAEIDSKQDALVAGTTIKNINGESILGEGNIVIPVINTVQAVGDSTTDIMSQKAVTDAIANISKKGEKIGEVSIVL